jgi:DNA-binding transcriptional regulator YhcF (GntR family)
MSATSRQPIRVELDPRLGQPAYLQIIRQLQRQISAGRVQPGAQLPTVRALARRLGVNFNTVARAYRLLARGGTLSTQPGRGTFVLPKSARRKRGNAALQELASEYIAHARRLRFSDTQIASALSHGLGRPAGSAQPGDNLG